jgi:hypothetical protein
VHEVLREGQLIAWVGGDHPDDYLFDGQPGVVIDVGPTPQDVTVSWASGPSLCVQAAELAAIEIDDFRARATRLRDGRHPTRDEPIAPLTVADPIDEPARPPPGVSP